MKRFALVAMLLACGGHRVSDPKNCLEEVKRTVTREGCELIGAGCKENETNPNRADCLFSMRCPDGERRDIPYTCMDVELEHP